METIFENRTISIAGSGFPDMYHYFMDPSPGAFGAMMGGHNNLELPTARFIGIMRAGSIEDGPAALEFLYGSIADLLGARKVVIWYDRDGWPMVKMRGDVFPNTQVSLDMAFLENSKSVIQYGYVFSDRLVFGEGMSRYYLGESIKSNRGLQLDVSGIYYENANAPDIVTQISRYPDLAKVVAELNNREKDPFTEELESAFEEGYSVYSYDPPSPAQRKVMEYYEVARYLAKLNCFAPTLNEIVEETQRLVPVAQRAYIAARHKLMPES